MKTATKEHVKITVSEWDPNKYSVDADGNELAPANPLCAMIETECCGARVTLAEMDPAGEGRFMMFAYLAAGSMEGVIVSLADVDTLVAALSAARERASE